MFHVEIHKAKNVPDGYTQKLRSALSQLQKVPFPPLAHACCIIDLLYIQLLSVISQCIRQLIVVETSYI